MNIKQSVNEKHLKHFCMFMHVYTARDRRAGFVSYQWGAMKLVFLTTNDHFSFFSHRVMSEHYTWNRHLPWENCCAYHPRETKYLEKQKIVSSMQHPNASTTKGTTMTQVAKRWLGNLSANTIRDFPSSEHTPPAAICYTGCSVTGADSKLFKSISKWQKGPWDLGTGESFGAAGWCSWQILKCGSLNWAAGLGLPLPPPPSHFLCSDLIEKNEIMPFGRWYYSSEGKREALEAGNFGKERKKGIMVMGQY